MKTIIIASYRDQALMHNVEGQDRRVHLAMFIAHMKCYTKKMENWYKERNGEKMECGVIIVQQSYDDRKFNRGGLLNSGYKIAKERYDLEEEDNVILHDIDLLPDDEMLELYSSRMEKKMRALMYGRGRYKSGGYNIVGGVLKIKCGYLEEINGYPRDFWGWGGEDDAFRHRILYKEGLEGMTKEDVLKSVIEYPELIGEMKDLEGEMTIKEKRQLLKSNIIMDNREKYEGLEENKKSWMLNGVCEQEYIEIVSMEMDKKIEQIVVVLM